MNAFRTGMDLVKTKDPVVWNRFMESTLGALIPPTVPTALKPIIEHITNRKFFSGKQVIPEYMEGFTEMELLSTEYTSSVAKFLGENLGIPPILVDHYITSLGGSLGRSFMKYTDGKNWTLDEPEDMFLVDRFYRTYERSAKTTSTVWGIGSSKHGEIIFQAYKNLKAYKENDDDAGAARYLQKLIDRDRQTDAIYAYRRIYKGAESVQSIPLNRLMEVFRSVGDVRRNLNKADNEEFSPSEKKNIGDMLSEIQIAEGRNAMIAMKVRGYGWKNPIDIREKYDNLREAYPTVYKALRRTYSDKNVSGGIRGGQRIYDRYERKMPSYLKGLERFISKNR